MRNRPFIFMASMVACCCLSAQKESSFLHYKISLPHGYQLVDKSPRMMDFCIFQIRNSKNKIISVIYAGNNPSTKFELSNNNEDNFSKPKLFEELPRKYKNYEALLKFNGLSYKSQNDSPWTYLHLFSVTTNKLDRELIIKAFENIWVSKAKIE